MGVLTAGVFRLHEKRLATRTRYKGRTPQTPGQRTDQKSSLEEPDDPGPVPFSSRDHKDRLHDRDGRAAIVTTPARRHMSLRHA